MWKVSITRKAHCPSRPPPTAQTLSLDLAGLQLTDHQASGAVSGPATGRDDGLPGPGGRAADGRPGSPEQGPQGRPPRAHHHHGHHHEEDALGERPGHGRGLTLNQSRKETVAR